MVLFVHCKALFYVLKPNEILLINKLSKKVNFCLWHERQSDSLHHQPTKPPNPDFFSYASGKCALCRYEGVLLKKTCSRTQKSCRTWLDFTLFSQVGKLVAQQLEWLKPTMHKNVNLFHSNEMNLLIYITFISLSFKSLEVLTFFPSRSPEMLLVKDISFWLNASATKLKLVN